MAIGTEKKQTNADVSRQYDEFVSERLARVRSYVKLRDIAGGLLLWLAGLLAVSIVVMLIDHWVCDLGVWGRLLAFAVLLFWTVVIVATRVLPPVVRSINPVYAAKVIEESDPSLKNSLLNLVFFRTRRQHLKEVVYRAVESDAVKRLAKVEVDHAVDQSSVIRIATVLASLMILFGIYAAISPKSPFQTLARIAAPWVNLARPARVRIVDIKPGAAEVYFGRPLDVSARIDRISEDETIWLVYSTDDQQVVDRRIPMSRDESSPRHVGTLPADDDGIRHNLSYRIEAGDAVAGPYRVRVVPAPSIVVDRVQYEFPKYTGKPDEVVENEGDVSALEGTRVTIIASTNEPISSSYIEFDADQNGGGAGAVRDTVPMSQDFASDDELRGDTLPDQRTKGTFTLLLTPDRSQPARQTYRLRFLNQKNETNDLPINYDIDVVPDFAPEVEILEPQQRETHLPVNDTRPIRLRAFDPDFQLTSVKLHVVASGKKIAAKELLTESIEGQVNRRLTFNPRKLALKPGDVAVIWATAADNRMHPVSSAEASNQTKTERFKIYIDEPVEHPKNPDRRRSPDREEQRSEDNENKSNDPQNNDAQNDAQDDGQPGDEGESGESGQRGQPGQPNSDQESSDESRGGSAEAGEGQQPSDGQGGADDNRSGRGGQQDGPPQGDQPQSGEQSGGEGQGQRQGQGKGKGKGAGDQRNASENTGGQNGPQGSAPDSASDGGHPQNGQTGEPTDGAPNNEPLASDGSEDGDAINRIMQRMREQGQDPQDSQQPQGGSQQDGQQQDQGQQGQGEQEQSQQGQGEQGQGEQGQGEQGQGQQGQGEQGQGQQGQGEQGQGEQGQGEQGQGQLGQGQQEQGEQGQGEQGQGEQGQGEQGQGQQGQGQQGQGQQGQGKQGQGQQGQGKQGQGQQGQGKQGQGQQGQGEQGQREQGQGEQGQGQQGQGQQGQGQQGQGEQGQGEQGQGQQGQGEQGQGQQGQGQQEQGEQGQGEQGQGEQGQGEQGQGEQGQGQQGQGQQGQGQQGQGEQGQGQQGQGQQGQGQQGQGEQGQGQQGQGEQGQGQQGQGEQGQGEQGQGEQGQGQQGQGEQGQGEQGQGEQGQGEQGQGEQGQGEQGQGQQGQGGQGQGQDSQSRDTTPRPSDPSDGAESGNQESPAGGDAGNQGANSDGTGEGADGQSRGDDGGLRSSPDGTIEGEPKTGQGQPGDQTNQTSRPGQAPKPQDGESSKSGSQRPSNSNNGSSGQVASDGTSQGGAGDHPAGGGGQRTTEAEPSNDQAAEPGGDAANLEYARKATNLVVEYLKDQQQTPDQKLLDDLGWSSEDLQRFINRWEQLQSDSQLPGEEGAQSQRELDDVLRGLGLQSGPDRSRQAGDRNDAAGGISDRGTRGRPPSEYLDQYKAYLKNRQVRGSEG